MSSRTSFKPIEVQVVYGECGHVLRKTQVIPIEVPTSPTSTSQKRNSFSRSSSRRSSWKSLLCGAAEQYEQESDNEADLDFKCQGLELVDNIPGLCPSCTARQERLIAEQQERDAEIIRLQVAQEQDEERARQRRAYRHMEDRRIKFRCEKCIKEDRNPVDRSGNEGFCCEFGRSFWYAKYPGAPAIPKRGASLEAPAAELKRMTIGTAEARQAATQAANSYGWQSRPDEWNRIEPNLVSQFVSTPGNHAGSLPGPAVPRYEDAHIDIERWNSQVRTNHGTYPKAAVPPPDKPLPLIPATKALRPQPLKISQQSTGRRESRREAHESKRDSDVSALSNPRDMSGASPVSPTNSHWPSTPQRPKTREEEREMRRQMSQLEHEIDDALEDWKAISENK
ncbi:hypothetical protein NHQ30_001073 [Ciborinia camelliae]|nr:hypothetical protein NHQ30_001073 [Ciborinia camelliae]